MIFNWPDWVWAPQRRGIEGVVNAWLRGKSACLYACTGGGKTACASLLFQWAKQTGFGTGCFYVNRKLLIGQTHARFIKDGLNCGIRAADYSDKFDWSAPFQICSADTERARVIDRDTWDYHDGQIIIVDEAHLQRTDTMRTILDHYKSKGAFIVGLTATPIGLSEWYDELVVSGTLDEYRECKAIVPAKVYGIQQPDVSKVKRNNTGEFIMDGKKKQIYTQAIVADVMSNWKRLNPDARPTMLFAPGVPESVWFTEKFMKMGVPWCHVDANDAIVDGVRRKLTRPLWDEIVERLRSGDIKGLSSRMKAREGIDIPNIYHCILATPIGSLASYIQIAGRVLRYSKETPDHVIIQDHGGCYLRHGDPNDDREWATYWDLPEHAVAEAHVNSIRDKKEPEPIRCPKCMLERKSGHVCPGCGFQHEKSKRHVIMEDGRLVEKEGKLIKPRYVKREPDTEQIWTGMVHGWRRKKVDRTFNQLAGYFAHENGYHPPRDLKMMPKRPEDWYRKVWAVSTEDLQ